MFLVEENIPLNMLIFTIVKISIKMKLLEKLNCYFYINLN